MPVQLGEPLQVVAILMQHSQQLCFMAQLRILYFRFFNFYSYIVSIFDVGTELDLPKGTFSEGSSHQELLSNYNAIWRELANNF